MSKAFESIPIAAYVFFGLFCVMSIVHLVFCFLELEKQRKFTKCFCTGLLSIAAIIAVPTSPLVYLGCIFGMLGDLLLLWKHKVWPLVCGTGLFFVGHVLYIVQFMVLSQPLNWAYYAATGAYCVLFPVVFYRFVHRFIHQRHLAAGAVGYFCFLLLDFIWAIIACTKGNFDYCFLAVLGAFSFIISDIFLVRTLFKKDVKRRDFYIMITYLLGEALIVCGLVFTILIR